MLKVFFSKTGKTVPDAKLEGWARSIANKYANSNGDMSITIGGSIMVDMLRVSALRGDIPYNDMVFIYDDDEIRVDKNSNLEEWPKGFCDVGTDLLCELMDWEPKKGG